MSSINQGKVMSSKFFAGSLGISCVLLLGLAGCVTIPKTEMNHQSAKSIKTVALLDVAEPKAEVVMNMGGGAAAFGLIGGLIQGGVNADHGKAYSKLVAAGQVQFSPTMIKSITDELNADGYHVVYLADQRPKLASDGKSDDFSNVHTDADAILEVWFTTLGYVSPPSKSAFEPWVAVKVRMLDSKSRKDLYFKTFFGGFKDKMIKNIVYVPADAKYQYKTFDMLTSSFADSVRGLQETEGAVASQVGRDLARGP